MHMASPPTFPFSTYKVISLVTEPHYPPDWDPVKLCQILCSKPHLPSLPFLILETVWPELLMSNESPFGDAHRNDDTGSGEAAAPHHSNTSADLPALYLTASPLPLIETVPNTRDSQTGSSGPEI